MREASRDRRRFPRLVITEPVGGNMAQVRDVRVLDISLGGARVRHTGNLAPGLAGQLRLPVSTMEFPLPCRVAWCNPVPQEKADGPSAFESGLEFGDLNPSAKAGLDAFLRSRRGFSRPEP